MTISSFPSPIVFTSSGFVCIITRWPIPHTAHSHSRPRFRRLMQMERFPLHIFNCCAISILLSFLKFLCPPTHYSTNAGPSPMHTAGPRRLTQLAAVTTLAQGDSVTRRKGRPVRGWRVVCLCRREHRQSEVLVAV